MQITPIYNKIYSSKALNNINFKGTNYTENIQGQKLIHETSFFRELDTDEFVKDYLVRTFLSKNMPVNIVVGACSAGYEVYSQAILYDEYKDRVDIFGFDLGPQAIEQAKSGEFIIQGPTYEAQDTSVCNDNFLVRANQKSVCQKKCQELFKKYFSLKAEKGINNSNMHPLWQYAFSFENNYKLNDGYGENCSFEVGDITKLDDILEDNSTHCLFFRNALYHLACDINANKALKRNSRQIIKNIAQDVNRKLVTGGLFVFGENEETQGINKNEVYEVMQECGFEPLNTDYRISKLPKRFYEYSKPAYTNVWRKVG